VSDAVRPPGASGGEADAERRRAAYDEWPWPRATDDADAAAACAQLGEAAFTAAWAEGQAMTLEQAVASALEQAGGDGQDD
jgi:hypothetical protein